MSLLRRLGQGTLTTARVVVTVSTLPLFFFASMIQSYRSRNDGEEDPEESKSA
jgi:hypothetical protein